MDLISFFHATVSQSVEICKENFPRSCCLFIFICIGSCVLVLVTARRRLSPSSLWLMIAIHLKVRCAKTMMNDTKQNHISHVLSESSKRRVTAFASAGRIWNSIKDVEAWSWFLSSSMAEVKIVGKFHCKLQETRFLHKFVISRDARGKIALKLHS